MHQSRMYLSLSGIPFSLQVSDQTGPELHNPHIPCLIEFKVVSVSLRGRNIFHSAALFPQIQHCKSVAIPMANGPGCDVLHGMTSNK